MVECGRQKAQNRIVQRFDLTRSSTLVGVQSMTNVDRVFLSLIRALEKNKKLDALSVYCFFPRPIVQSYLLRDLFIFSLVTGPYYVHLILSCPTHRANELVASSR